MKWIRKQKTKKEREAADREQRLQADWFMKGWESGYMYYRDHYDRKNVYINKEYALEMGKRLFERES